jgi:hypothetical protein
MFCLPKHYVNEFLEKLKSGEITPEKLLDMNSEQRRSYFSGFLGENNAREVNKLLESKLILKNQQRGIINWAKQVSGLKPESRRDMLNRVSKMTEVLTPENEQEFLEDLAAHKLGVYVSMEEAADITELSRLANEKKDAMESGQRREKGSVKATRPEMEYGRALIAFDNYIAAIKESANKRTIPELIKGFINQPFVEIRNVITGTAGAVKGIVASVDDSFIGRQGIQLFFKGITGDIESLKTWSDTFAKSFKYIWDTFRGKPVMDEMKAIIVSDPDYLTIKRTGTAIGTIEEMYPVSWPEKVPYFGKVFEASENAYVGSAHWMRYRVIKQYLDIAEKAGIDLTDNQQLKSIGKLVNSLTARGDTGAKRQRPGVINAVFWSPKMIKGAIDVLTAHQFDPNISDFAKRQATINLIRIIVGTGAVLFIADLIRPGSVEWDSRSADFGKIKIRNTRFTVNPFVPFIVLASRLIPTKHNDKWGIWSKSTTTGMYSNLWEKGYGKKTAFDIFVNFLSNKTAPMASEVINIWKNQSREDFKKPYSPKESAKRLVTPMSIQNYNELAKDPDSANVFIGTLADVFGISTQTYGMTEKEIIEQIQKNTNKDGSTKKGKEEYVQKLKEKLKEVRSY